MFRKGWPSKAPNEEGCTPMGLVGEMADNRKGGQRAGHRVTVHGHSDRQRSPGNDQRNGWKDWKKRKSDSIGQKVIPGNRNMT